MMRTVVTLTQDEVSLLLALLVTCRPTNGEAASTIRDLLTKLGPFSPDIEKFPHRPNR